MKQSPSWLFEQPGNRKQLEGNLDHMFKCGGLELEIQTEEDSGKIELMYANTEIWSVATITSHLLCRG